MRGYTGLTPEGPEPPVLVIDRPGWVDVNVESFAFLLTPLLDKMSEARPRAAASMVKGVGSKVTGTELGALLSFVGTKVLGQYEPFTAVAGPAGRPSATAVRARCCWSRRTSSPWSASSASTRTTSGCGSACTRRPTAPSSRPCRGWPGTSTG